jgi:hypothetical protein
MTGLKQCVTNLNIDLEKGNKRTGTEGRGRKQNVDVARGMKAHVPARIYFSASQPTQIGENINNGRPLDEPNDELTVFCDGLLERSKH